MSRLSTEQLARMSRLLDEVVDADEASRRSWLQALPDEHRDLEPALRKALFAAPDYGARLDTLPKLGDPASGLRIGDRVGPYRLVRPLGSGGMAEVWLAQRADGAFRREVALKTPAHAGEREDLARRFAVERDILAALEHPRIARFYDAGVADDGRPYLALEYVPGRSLLRWADAQRLDIRERVAMFLQVVEAVQYAHDKGVLHRDLKPANLLVTDAGQVTLLDFGVARAMQQPAQAELTQAFGPALTPAYASPEQLEGAGLDVTTDVYSLGVVLYELLAGRQPHPRTARRNAPPVPVQAQAPPSATIDAAAADVRGATTARVRRTLSGDLDAIVLKAMAASPSRRYDSAAALGSDLRRWLAHEPVHAVAGALPYRAAKFVSRHRHALAQAALVALVGVGLGRALLEVPAPHDDVAASQPTTGAPPVASAVPAVPDAVALRKLEARALLRQGEVYANGPFERDAERAEVTFRKAAALTPDDALPWARLAMLHLQRALSAPSSRDERHAMAREAIDTALQIDPHSMAALAARFGYAVRVDHDWADARTTLDRMRMIDTNDRAWLPACEAQMAAAHGRLQEAVSIQRQLVERDPTNPGAIATLASYLFHADQLPGAMALFHRELQINPHARGTHGRIGVTLALLGRGDQAMAAIAEEQQPATRLWALSAAHWTLGHRAESDAALDELLREPKGHAYAIAQLLALRGRRAAAIEWLGRACLDRQGGCEQVKADRFLRGLRDDPRYRALLAKMKLEPDSARPAR